MGKHVLTIVVAVIIAASLLLYMFAFQVRTNEVAVVLTFGRPEERIYEPGYHFKWPWPIQEVRRFDNRLHVREGRLEESYTRDRYNIITSVCVGWKIADRFKFNRNFGASKDPIESAWLDLREIVRDRTLAVLGQHDLRDLVSVDREKLRYDEIESKIVAAADEAAQETYGIQVALLKIKRLELPDSVKQKVYDRMTSERMREAQTTKSEGEQAAAVIKANAESQRDQILALARSEAERIRGEGDAEAARYYKVFAENPELAIFLRQIRALREVAKDKTTVILDTTTPPFNLFKEEPPEPRPPKLAAKDPGLKKEPDADTETP